MMDASSTVESERAEPGANPQQIRAEIWDSLLSMLRVYAYAASVNHGEFRLTFVPSGGLRIEHEQLTLLLSLDTASGAGSWRLAEAAIERSGDLRIQDDGRLLVDGTEKALDQAAIEWIECLTKAARKQSS
ncbi:MAG TPA: hypothetical protein VGR96_02015 [Acidobacteriaceae bacterium]|nr:hypothetical protein [Acidobacteriaceae bacterium]